MASKTETTPKQTAGGCLLLIVVVLAGVFGFKACMSSDSGSYKATVGDFVVVNPADLAVTLHVTNTGTKAGTPQCTVQAHDPSYTYHGEDIGSLTDPVQPGETKTAVMNLTITKEGASFVTDVTVTCS